MSHKGDKFLLTVISVSYFSFRATIPIVVVETALHGFVKKHAERYRTDECYLNITLQKPTHYIDFLHIKRYLLEILMNFCFALESSVVTVSQISTSVTVQNTPLRKNIPYSMFWLRQNITVTDLFIYTLSIIISSQIDKHN